MALPGSDEPVSIQEAEARQELLGLIIALNPDRRSETMDVIRLTDQLGRAT